MNNILSSFGFTFVLCDSDFSKPLDKSLKVNLFDGKDGWNKGFFFEVAIPDYLYNFVRDKHPDYSDWVEEHGLKQEHKFRHFIRKQSFSELKSALEQMSVDALFFKKVSLMDKLNKVIFIKCNYFNQHIRDNYNFADMNNNYELSFNFFVAYEVKKVNPFKENNTELWYYGLKRVGDQSMRLHNTGNLPLINATNLSKYVKIKWTQEREDFLEDTAKKIGKVSELIDGYVKKINDENFEQIIKSTNNKFLEYKGD